MSINYQNGVGICKDWKLENGDLKTVQYDDNLQQGLENRLTANIGELFFDTNYGSNLPEYLGKHNTEANRTLIEKEVEDVCGDDFRVTSADATLNSYTSNSIDVDVTVTTTYDSTIDYHIVLGVDDL